MRRNYVKRKFHPAQMHCKQSSTRKNKLEIYIESDRDRDKGMGCRLRPFVRRRSHSRHTFFQWLISDHCIKSGNLSKTIGRCFITNILYTTTKYIPIWTFVVVAPTAESKLSKISHPKCLDFVAVAHISMLFFFLHHSFWFRTAFVDHKTNRSANQCRPRL